MNPRSVGSPVSQVPLHDETVLHLAHDLELRVDIPVIVERMAEQAHGGSALRITYH
jgi:hypothetical protein